MGEKKIKGRKRHLVTDTAGHILHVKVHKANIHDTIGGCEVFKEALEKYPTLEGVCADKGYRKTFKLFVQNILKRTVAICSGIKNQWMILPKRWIVERTFAWLNHFRRLSKDYEITKRAEENNVMIAHSILLLKRLYKLWKQVLIFSRKTVILFLEKIFKILYSEFTESFKHSKDL